MILILPWILFRDTVPDNTIWYYSVFLNPNYRAVFPSDVCFSFPIKACYHLHKFKGINSFFFFPPPLALFFSLPQPTAEFLMTSYFLETERKERNSSWPREGSQTFSSALCCGYLACSLVPAVLTNPTGAARNFMPGHNSLYRPNPEEIA